MASQDRKAHWENVYHTKTDTEVSWHEETPTLSLELIREAGAIERSLIIDIGGGASRLVDSLLRGGYDDVSVLDISATALEAAKARPGMVNARVSWIVADVTRWEPHRHYGVWHDRATFHFLIDTADQEAYARTLKRSLDPGGVAIVGTFALDGPERCSGLPVRRHDGASIRQILGLGFELVDTRRHLHTTPSGTTQRFQFSSFRRAK